MVLMNDFTCKCGCGKNLIKNDVINLCEKINRQVGIQITINSGYRCANHNSNIGGERNSQHLLGNAADLTCANMTKLKDICKSMWSRNEIGGLGLYSNFVHIDIGQHRTWTR